MIRRLRQLFGRYATAHAHLSAPREEIRDTEGRTLGYLEGVVLSEGRLRVHGWVRAEKVTLFAGGGSISMRPILYRADVAQSTGGAPAAGFDLVLPCAWDTLRDSAVPGLVVQPSGPAAKPISISLTGLRPRSVLVQQAPRFAVALMRALPPMAGWAATQSPRQKARIKRLLGLTGLPVAGQPIDPAVLAPPPASPPAPPLVSPLAPLPAPGPGAAPGAPSRDDVTVLLPVFNAFDLLPEVLDRVVQNTDLGLRLVVIEDCSTDPGVRPFLRDRVARMSGAMPPPLVSVTLLENDENLGFIRSVNRGLAHALGPDGGTGPVVLLNSDAFVPAGWASRLVAPLADPAVASVTPMSNDAEIFSVPAVCRPTPLRPGQGDAIDRAAAALAPGEGLAEVPTGVGFCMALARSWLQREPAFDTAFGRGYGEEVDWCQKVHARGGRHLGLPGLFVEHRGGSSFGSVEKLARVAANNALVARRYPDYDAEVQRFIAADPLSTARLALSLAWAGSLGEEVPVYLAHSLGGGAEHYLEQRVAGDVERLGAAVVLRVGGAQRWQVELISPQGRVVGTTDETALVERLLEALPRRALIYSCGVGDSDPVELPRLLAGLKRPQDRIEVQFHDYFPLSPSYTLLDSDHVYRGTPGPDRRDPAHQLRRPDGTLVTLAAWQAAWRQLAEEADEVRVFSEDGIAQVSAVWPDLAGRIRVVPHSLRHRPAPVPVPGGAPVIGVLGNIGLQKGAALLQVLARQLKPGAPGRPGLVLVGNIDPAYALPGWVTVTGDYRPEDIPGLAKTHRISHWLIPSIWPETFSFTTHEALATGLPVMAFDLGAQGAAVAAAANGRVLPLKGDPVAAVLDAVRPEFRENGVTRVAIETLAARGVEVLPRGGPEITLPRHSVIEAPASLKWTRYEHSLELGAFSYQVSGFCCAARIGRYCSFGEEVEIGRQNHPTDWVSTSPHLYLRDRPFATGGDYAGAAEYGAYTFGTFANGPPTQARITTIGNDVWIGHGAMVRAGVTVGDGAVIGGGAVVARDVPPYAVVAGNPATILRFRLAPGLISPMLRSRWWRFAPWQLTQLDPSRPDEFLRGIWKMNDVPPFEPDVFDLRNA